MSGALTGGRNVLERARPAGPESLLRCGLFRNSGVTLYPAEHPLLWRIAPIPYPKVVRILAGMEPGEQVALRITGDFGTRPVRDG